MENYTIKNAVPAGKSAPRDVHITDGVIAAAPAPDARVINAAGLTLFPGLADAHTHFRDPGFTRKEDIQSGAAAAAAGGVTTALCMPNTSPVIDTPELVRYVLDAAKNAAATVLPIAAVTVGQKGVALTDFAALKSAGAAALSDDGSPVSSADVMRRALIAASAAGLVIISHCEDADMVKNYAVNEGEVSRRLGIPGRPAIAEELMVARDCMLALETGARAHIAHVSTAGSVEIIRRAKALGAPVTAETCPQYFTLTEDEILRRGPLARVNPPLRTRRDVDAVIAGLCDGTLDIIVTDHAPHTDEEKARPLGDAPSGMIGLETSLAVTLTELYRTGILPLAGIAVKMSQRPAELFGLPTNSVAAGETANLTLVDLNEEWTVTREDFRSKSKNSAFLGKVLRGRVKLTISRGGIVYGGQYVV
ncbi:MAG: dihydroorotase [Oscillospiraceae bacterium]|jgi:dihydroorotase|nr:dihydroorotase [Oscillospiraceae bacterium]